MTDQPTDPEREAEKADLKRLRRHLERLAARAEAAEAELERLRKVVEQAASDLTSAGLDWQSNRYGMKSHGGRGLFFRHTHVLFRLLHALKPQPQEAMTEVGIDLARPGSEDKSVKATRYPDGTVHIEEIRSDD